MVGMLALAGVPPFAGFFSKDEVLLVTYHRSKLAWGLATFAAFLTAFYMTRQICMVFFGKWRGGEHEQEHEKEHEEKHEHEQGMGMAMEIMSHTRFRGTCGCRLRC